MNTATIVLLISNIPFILVALFASTQYKGYNKELRLFSGFLFVSAIVQIISGILFFFAINNMPILHVYTAIGGIQLLLFYRAVFKETISPLIISTIAIFFGIFVIFNTLFVEGIFTFNSNALTVEAAILATLSLTYFNISLVNSGLKKQSNNHFQWINSGVFIYFSSNLLLYYFSDYIIEEVLSGVPFLNVWTLYALPIFGAYTCYSIGLWKITRHSK